MLHLNPELAVYHPHGRVAHMHFAGYLAYAVLLRIFYAASKQHLSDRRAVRPLGGGERTEVGVALPREEVRIEGHPQPACDPPRFSVYGHEHPLAVALQRLLQFL